MERLLRNEAHERGAIEFAGPIGVPTGKIANGREAGGGVVRSSMFHTRTDDGDRTVVRVDGVLDATTVAIVRATLDQVVADGRRHVAVDLGHLRLIDSTGIGAIVSTFK